MHESLLLHTLATNMRILDRYLFTEILGPFLFGLCIFATLLFAGDLLRKLMKLVIETGVPASQMLRVLLYRLPSVIVLTFPMATLLAVLLAFGGLSMRGEITAALAGGASFHRLMVPVYVFGVLVTGVMMVFDEVVVPPANLAADELLIALGAKAQKEQGGVLLRDPASGQIQSIIYASRFDATRGVLDSPYIFVMPRGELVAVIRARTAVWDKDRQTWQLTDPLIKPVGRTQEEIKRWDLEIAGKGLTRTIGQTPAQIEEAATKLVPANMTFVQLSQYIARIGSRPGPHPDLNEALVERQNKLALPFACLVFATMAAPLALRPQRSTTAIGLGLSVVIILLYYVVWYYACLLGENGRLPPVLAAWAADLVTAGLGFALVSRASG